MSFYVYDDQYSINVNTFINIDFRRFNMNITANSRAAISNSIPVAWGNQSLWAQIRADFTGYKYITIKNINIIGFTRTLFSASDFGIDIRSHIFRKHFGLSVGLHNAIIAPATLSDNNKNLYYHPSGLANNTYIPGDHQSFINLEIPCLIEGDIYLSVILNHNWTEGHAKDQTDIINHIQDKYKIVRPTGFNYYSLISIQGEII